MKWIVLAAAVVVLDASLTFENVWPTPAVRWQGDLSIELAACILALVVAHRRFGPPSRSALDWLSVLWLLLVVGRYAEVTAPALYGRDINLYWDLRFIPDVVAMVTRVAPAWLVVLSTAAAVTILVLLYWLLRWAWRSVGAAMADGRQRRVLTVLSAAGLVLVVAPRASAPVSGADVFAAPVTRTYARQARFVAAPLGGSKDLPERPAIA